MRQLFIERSGAWELGKAMAGRITLPSTWEPQWGIFCTWYNNAAVCHLQVLETRDTLFRDDATLNVVQAGQVGQRQQALELLQVEGLVIPAHGDECRHAPDAHTHTRHQSQKRQKSCYKFE